MASPSLYLAPTPRQLVFQPGTFVSQSRSYSRLIADDPQALLPAARQAGLPYAITASPVVPTAQVGLTIRLDPTAKIPTEGYRLAITPQGVEIVAPQPAGAFYGACTLAQIHRQCGDELPCLEIEDWPDVPARGLMLDISRDKVPTQETLYHLVDLLASWKMNQLQLYTEHTFAYTNHRVVWEEASPMTAEQIMDLDRYCRSKFIELVPNQNSFGHMERWLKHEEYLPLAEAPNGCDFPWGGHADLPFSLAPGEPGSLELLAGLYDELLPHFTSRLFNIGGDETFDLGQGKSKALCEKLGTERVYLDFLLKINRESEKHGRTMMFWGDIIMHKPELIADLPKNVIALEWGYEANHPFEEHGKHFQDSGVPFYVCPGASNWNTLAGRTENVIGNITNAARNGLANGAIGMLNTSWGDNGHHEPLSVAYAGYFIGACCSWNAADDVRDRLAEKLSLHAFGDSTGTLGRAYCDLGNLYRCFKKETSNSAMPYLLVFYPEHEGLQEITVAELDAMERRLNEIVATLDGAVPTCADAEIVREEVAHVIRLLRLSLIFGRIYLGSPKPAGWSQQIETIKEAQRHIWLLRNRPGGLEDSLARIKST